MIHEPIPLPAIGLIPEAVLRRMCRHQDDMAFLRMDPFMDAHGGSTTMYGLWKDALPFHVAFPTRNWAEFTLYGARPGSEPYNRLIKALLSGIDYVTYTSRYAMFPVTIGSDGRPYGFECIIGFIGPNSLQVEVSFDTPYRMGDLHGYLSRLSIAGDALLGLTRESAANSYRIAVRDATCVGGQLTELDYSNILYIRAVGDDAVVTLGMPNPYYPHDGAPALVFSIPWWELEAIIWLVERRRNELLTPA